MTPEQLKLLMQWAEARADLSYYECEHFDAPHARKTEEGLRKKLYGEFGFRRGRDGWPCRAESDRSLAKATTGELRNCLCDECAEKLMRRGQKL